MSEGLAVVSVFNFIGYPIGIISAIVIIISLFQLFSISDNYDNMMSPLFRLIFSFIGISTSINLIGTENILNLLIAIGIIASGTIFGTTGYWLTNKLKTHLAYKNFKNKITDLTNIPDNFENLAKNIEVIEVSLIQIGQKIHEIKETDKQKKSELTKLQKLLLIKKATFENIMKNLKEEQPELSYKLNI